MDSKKPMEELCPIEQGNQDNVGDVLGVRPEEIAEIINSDNVPDLDPGLNPQIEAAGAPNEADGDMNMELADFIDDNAPVFDMFYEMGLNFIALLSFVEAGFLLYQVIFQFEFEPLLFSNFGSLYCIMFLHAICWLVGILIHR